MKRIVLAIAGLALISVGAGCCCHRMHANPCNPCGPAFGAAYMAPAATTAYYAPVAAPVASCPDCTGSIATY